jgi:Tfp pilus assembly protein PilN
MRPINLIPDDERRRSVGVATRTGPVAYLLVGVLGVLLIGIVMLVLFTNSIHGREGEVTRLESEKAVVSAQASKLAAYVNFKQVAETRSRTVSELADARFDWARVIRQLSLVLPGDIYLDKLTASGGGGGSESGIVGPSLALVGCGFNQPAVGSFITALREIDGVTRVQLTKSTIVATGSSSGAGSDPCAVSGKAQFEMVVAFDAAPPSPDSATAIAEEPEEAEASSEPEGSSEGEGEGESSAGEGSSQSTEPEGASGSTQSAAAPVAGAAG